MRLPEQASSHPYDQRDRTGTEQHQRTRLRHSRWLRVEKIVHDRNVDDAAIVDGGAERGVPARDPDAADHRRVELDAEELERLISQQRRHRKGAERIVEEIEELEAAAGQIDIAEDGAEGRRDGRRGRSGQEERDIGHVAPDRREQPLRAERLEVAEIRRVDVAEIGRRNSCVRAHFKTGSRASKRRRLEGC